MEHSGEKALRAARAALERLRDALAALDAYRAGTRAASGHKADLPTLRGIDRLLAPTLAIAGEEGAGKSTLVNAIFGLPLVPTDANSPGTVAPIAIAADVSAPLSYVVERYGSDDRIECADRSAFASYLLQRENPDNTKRVRQGVIRAAGPQWADGLQLIDLPGLGGISEAVQQEVAAALGHVESALLVINDRNAAPGLKVAGRLKALGGNVDAVIINLRSSKLLDDETRQAFSDEMIAANISAIRSFVGEAAERLGFDIPAARIFAIHLPAMRELALVRNADMNAPAHADEAARFAAWLHAGYGREGAGARLSQALEIASTIIDDHVRAEQDEIALLAGIRRGDPASIEQAGAALERRRKLLSARWSEALKRAGADAAAEVASAHIERAIQSLKTCLTELHQTCRASLSTEKLHWDAGDRNRIAITLSRGAAGAARELERHRDTALKIYLDVCKKAAEAVAEDDDILSLIHVPIESADFGSARLWREPHFEVEQGGFLGFEWAWSAPSIDRMLREIRHIEMTIDASREGPIATAFQTQMKARRAAQHACLEERLDMIAAMIADPDHPALLAAERASKRRSELIGEAQDARAKCRRAMNQLNEIDRVRLEKDPRQRAVSGARRRANLQP
jgi:hypothetical protein